MGEVLMINCSKIDETFLLFTKDDDDEIFFT